MPKQVQTALWIVGVVVFLYLAIEINRVEAYTVVPTNPPALPPSNNADPYDGVNVQLCEYPQERQTPYVQPSIAANIAPTLSHNLPTLLPAQNGTTKPEESGNFIHSADFRTVKYQGKEYHLTTAQAIVVKRLYEYMQKEIKSVHQSTLLEGRFVCSTRLRDVFKGSPAWKSLLMTVGKGYFCLNCALFSIHTQFRFN